MSSFLRPDLAELAAYSAHAATAAEAAAPALVDPLDTNECPYDLPAELKEKLAWRYQREIAANRYPDGGHAGLKQAIADYVNESADLATNAIAAQHISVGNGSDELIRSLLIATCSSRAGSILVAPPTFSMYGILAQTLGIPVATVGRHEQTFAVDLAAAQSAIAEAAVPIRAVFMVHPNSPTGNALTAAELDWLRQLPEDVLVVVDEAYFEFSQQTTAAAVLERPNWVVLRTFSKAFRLAAHRVGYAIAAPEIIQVLEKIRLPYNLPSVSQAAAQLVLAHRQQLLAAVPPLLASRDRLYQELASWSDFQVWPSDANFLYGRPLTHDADAVFQSLKQQGTLIRHTGGGFRITIGTPEENGRTQQHLLRSLQTGSKTP